MAEHTDGIGVAVHHHVGESNIVVCRKVSSHDAREHCLLVELDVVQGLESKTKVTQQAVDAQETDDREVSQHLVEVLGTIFTSNSKRVLIALHGGELLGDLRTLDERVQHVEDTVASPGVGVLLEHLKFLIVGGLSGDSHTVGRERVELVNELVDDIPSPVVLFYTLVSMNYFTSKLLLPTLQHWSRSKDRLRAD